MNTFEDQARKSHLDWALREATGGERPPELESRVRERMQSLADDGKDHHLGGDDRSAPAAAVLPTWRNWLSAASVLFGLAVVLTIAFGKRNGREGDTATQPNAAMTALGRSKSGGTETLPAWLTVRSAKGLADAPPTTQRLRLRGISAAEFVQAALALPDLRALDLAATDMDPVGPLDRAALTKIASFSKLETLLLPGREELTAAGFEQLTGLPLLSRLDLARTQIDSDSLGQIARMPSLRDLNLSFNQGVTDTSLGAVLRATPGLRRLSVRGCGALRLESMADFEKLRQLEHLDLGWLVGVDFAAELRRLPVQLAGQLSMAHFFILSGNEEQRIQLVDDEVVMSLARIPSLRSLDLSGSNAITTTGMRALGAVAIETFKLECSEAITSEMLEVLPPSVRDLHVEMTDIDDECLRVLAKHHALANVNITDCANVTDAGLTAVLDAHDLKEIRIANCSGLTAACLPRLLKEQTLTRIDTTDLPWMDAKAIAQLEAMPAMREVRHGTSGAQAPSVQAPRPQGPGKQEPGGHAPGLEVPNAPAPRRPKK